MTEENWDKKLKLLEQQEHAERELQKAETKLNTYKHHYNECQRQFVKAVNDLKEARNALEAELDGFLDVSQDRRYKTTIEESND